MSAVGSAYNVRYGFKIGDTSLVTVGGTSMGMIKDRISIRSSRSYSPIRTDQHEGPIDLLIATADAFISFTMAEVLGGHLAAAFDAGAYASSSMVLNSSHAGQVALVVNAKGPDGSTRTITMGKAVSIGGEWSLPFNADQTIAAEFQAVADLANSGRLLMSVDS